MACDISTLIDPVQGLVDFVNDIKPYHTKIVEVIVEYQHTENIDVTIIDDMDLRIQIVHPDPDTTLIIGSCPILDKQIWGAMADQVTFQLDNPLSYLTVIDEYSSSPGQTVFDLSHIVNASDPSNIAAVKVNGTPTTSYTLDPGAISITLTSPVIQRGDYVTIEYLSSTPDTSRFTVTVNGVAAEISMTMTNEFTIISPLPISLNDWIVSTLCGPPDDDFVCYDGYDTTVYDDPDTFVLSTVDDVTNTVIVPRNRTHEFVAGTEILIKTGMISSSGGSPLTLPVDFADNLRVYTVLSSTFTAGTVTTDPFTTIVVDTSIRGIDPPTTSLPAGYEFTYYAGLNPLVLKDVLGYSDADDRPLETPNEGRLVLDVVGITSNTITVDGDLGSSTLEPQDTFFVSGSTDSSGSYAIVSVTYNSGPGTTDIVVTETILNPGLGSDTPTAIFDIMSNAFIINGSVASRFRQGHIFNVDNGSNKGTYVTLVADSVSIETGRETLAVLSGQVGFTLASSTIAGVSQQATDLGIADSSLLSVKLKRNNQLITIGVTATSTTTFLVTSGPLPLLGTDELIASTLERCTRVRVTDELIPDGIGGFLKDYPLGFGSQQIFCDQLPYTYVRVLMKEHLQFSNMSLNLTDDIIAYNLENTDQVVYDGVPQGTEFNPFEPSSPVVFDYWYPALPISGISGTGNEVTIVGDWRLVYPAFSTFTITGSATNAGTYTILITPTYDHPTRTTTLTVASIDDVPALDSLGMIVDPTTIATYPLAVYQNVSDPRLSGPFEGSPSPWPYPLWRLQQHGYSEVKSAVSTIGIVGEEIWGAAAGQVTYTLAGGSPYSFSLPTGSPLDTALMSVTLNGVPVSFTVDSSTTFTITDATIPGEGDIVAIVVREFGVNTELNAYVNPYDGDPNTVDHTGVIGSDANSTLTLAGGNYLRRMTPDLVLTGTSVGSPESLVGTWRPAYYTVIDVDAGANTITIPSDVSHLFSGGSPFGDILLMHSENNDEEFIIQNVVVSGSPLVTTITLTSPSVIENEFLNPPTGSPLGSPATGDPILQNYSRDLGWITAGSFNPATQDTILAAVPLDTASPLPLISEVSHLSYVIVGPLRFDIKLYQNILALTTVNDAMGIAEDPLGVPQLFNIIEIDLINNTYTIEGDYRDSFNQGTNFSIQGSYKNLNNQSSWAEPNVPWQWDIIDTDTSTNVIYVDGDATDYIDVNDRGEIVGSLSNDDEYYVVSATYGGSPLDDRTAVELNGPIIQIGSPGNESIGPPPVLESPPADQVFNIIDTIVLAAQGSPFVPFTNDFVIVGNHTGIFSSGFVFDVQGSEFNDRTWRVVDSTYDIIGSPPVGTTTISVVAVNGSPLPEVIEPTGSPLQHGTITYTPPPIHGTFQIGGPTGVPNPWTVEPVLNPELGSPVCIGSPPVLLGSPDFCFLPTYTGAVLGEGSPITTVITVVEPINTEGSPPVANIPYGTIVLVQTVIGSTPVNQAATSFEDTLFFGWGTTQRWQIIAQDAATNTIYLEGDVAGMIYVNDDGNIVGSLYNDADYQVVSAIHNPSSDRTAVVLKGPIIFVGSPPMETVGPPPVLAGSPPTIVGSPQDYTLFGMWQLDDIDITNWFQYLIIGANSSENSFTVQGDATTDIFPGQEFRIFGTPGNDGLYKTDSVAYITTGSPAIGKTVIQATSPQGSPEKYSQVSVSQGTPSGSPIGSPIIPGGGVLQAARDYGIQIFFTDAVGTTYTETLNGPVPTEGGNIVGAFDYPTFDMDIFDDDEDVNPFFTDPNEKP